ncbi:MAG: low-specificity L-threonine aldolase [Ectothiorhodospiraceae bacterium AqS1]|nr:low-specificity L-threonine aldolase [Ectothiorhodospiraceae bacterium AqS1]MBF2761026.1 low-specificity L-threonine aldolase [Ectothiorhodospiraceae bacterium AqS1]
MQTIDFRSDTVTLPTASMRKAMAEAEVGDDVFGEDPTVNRLEAMGCERFGQEAAVFVSSGTQGNLLALLAHCGRGDEYICGHRAHNYRTEGGGAAALGGIQPQPIQSQPDGTLDLDEVIATIKPDDFHYARTRLLSLENTISGRVLGVDYMRDARRVCDAHGLSFHLDGARVCNAAIHSKVEPAAITSLFDSVSICLSKGLGAPAGTLLVGKRDLIKEARRWRKIVGGGMRQAGILAAAGIHALERHIDRMAEDHANARRLADGLMGIEGIDIDHNAVQTNMVFAKVAPDRFQSLGEHCEKHGIRIDNGNPVRLVTHLDIDERSIDRTIEVIGDFFRS